MKKSKSILIIDDDTQLLSVLHIKFEQEGYKVFVAKDGLEGLEQAFKEHPDLILLDLRMPRMDGENFLAKLRDNPWGKDVPVLILTNSDSGRTIYVNIKDSVQGYFVKAEISLKEILKAVEVQLNDNKKV